MAISLAQFRLATGASDENAALYYDPAVEACERFEISTPAQLAAFCATMSVESVQLSHMEEDLYYRDAARLASLFRRVFDTDHDGEITQDEIDAARAYCRMPKELSKKLYNGYHGRGAGQLTWEKNYKLHGDRLGFDYVGDPDMVKTPEHAILSFASFWDLNGCNDVADNMDEVTRRVNGPKRLALAERISRFNTALTAWS